MRICSFDGCGRPHRALGVCKTHYYQLKRKGVLAPIEARRGSLHGEWGPWYVNDHGYVERRRNVKGVVGRQKQHRVVMEEMLGRPLLPGENVHHKDRDKTNNDPSNLELWVTGQPAGGRVEDLLVWADEIIARYR